MAATEIPHDLDLVIEFVNTFDPDDESDAFETPGALAGWLFERGLLSDEAGPPTASDRGLATALRDALRSLMLANNGEPIDPDAARELERVARRGELGVHFSAAGTVGLQPEDRGVPGALARVLIPVADAMGDGSWSRVKACRASDCQWAFYDRSRNRSGVWCDMAVCGNRTKVRAYRARGAVARG